MQHYIKLSSINSFSTYRSKMNSNDEVGQQQHRHQQQRQQQQQSRSQNTTDKVSVKSLPAATSGERKLRDKSVEFNSNFEIRTIESPVTDRESANHARAMSHTNSNSSNLDRHQPSVEDVKQFDVVIFAASGCVGRFLVEELALVVDKYYKSLTGSSSPAQQYAQQLLRRRSVPSSSSNRNEIRWAIAGRSAVRLTEALGRAELSTGIKGLSNSIPVVLADLNHQKSLLDMCHKTRLVINCAGPYAELGAEVLIQACIESQTDYVDLSHELTFIENMRQKYSAKAKRAGVFILNGCGFQSMSAEMGLNFTKQVCDGTIEQIKIILSLSDTSALVKSPTSPPRSTGIISEGMWNSLLAEKAHEIPVEDRLRQASLSTLNDFNSEQLSPELNGAGGNTHATKRLVESVTSSSKALSGNNANNNPTSQDRKLFPTRMLARKDTQSLVKDIVQFRNRSVSIAWPLRMIQSFRSKRGRGFCWPIDNMSFDEAQLIRSEMTNYELRRPDLDSDEGWRPIRCTTFLSVKNFTQLSLLLVWLFIFQILVKFSLFRFLMRKFPQISSLGHVLSARDAVGQGGQQQSAGQQLIERESLSHIKFCQTFIAYGTPGDDSGDPLEQRDRYSTRKQVQLLVSRVVGPEPNHIATATYAIQAAITLLTERDHLPCKGGVLTPGSALSETNIIYQLRRRNIKFEVLKKA